MIDFFAPLIHALLIVSVIGIILGFLGSKIPFISSNSLILRVASTIAFAFSIYAEGMIANNAKWEEQVKELREAIKVAEAKAKEENVRVETKVVERIKYVRGKTETVIARVPIYITKEVDRAYPVPNSFVILHDSAARSEVPPSTSSSYEGTSDVKISEVTRTVTENYGTCNEVREQLLGWQEWYKAQKKIYEAIK